jgi:hypothetical protein
VVAFPWRDEKINQKGGGKAPFDNEGIRVGATRLLSSKQVRSMKL